MIQIYRLAVIALIAWLIRDHHTRLRVQGDRPITAHEVRDFLPETHKLKPDPGPRAGLIAFDKAGNRIGYAARTMPHSKQIIGYSGPTDGLIVLDSDDKVLGVKIRHSYDTPSHVEDVRLELLFMESWNGRTWDEIAAITDLAKEEIWAVSGATRTSEALAESISYRMRVGTENSNRSSVFGFRWQDAVLILVLIGGCVFAFAKSEKIQRWRLAFSIGSVGIFGILLGDLLAQSLLIGWAESGIPWRTTPGLVLFAAAMFVIPWITRQPVYCQFICPHGILQRWMMKLRPQKWRVRLGEDRKWVARLIPVFLLGLVALVTFFQLPIDLAGIEPFDAWLIRSAGLATILIFTVGLLVSFFIPMAYCKYGCPTGLLLEFVRRRSGPGEFGVRDWTGLVFLIVALGLHILLK
ncbi:MAG: 4Fe-4S binding protein [Verrucomicrobiales bacterium]|nr:4Fe-4S binding protein [Verrucomicrobiales bacterium]